MQRINLSHLVSGQHTVGQSTLHFGDYEVSQHVEAVAVRVHADGGAIWCPHREVAVFVEPDDRRFRRLFVHQTHGLVTTAGTEHYNIVYMYLFCTNKYNKQRRLIN